MELVTGRRDAVAVGECMLEVSGVGAGCRFSFGGDTFNTALYLARLGLEVSYLTALGTDPFSDDLRAHWREEGVALDLVLTDPERLPGLYIIRADERGERSFYYWREGSAARHLFELPGLADALDVMARARLVYLSGVTLSLFDVAERDCLLDICRLTRSNGGTVAFDPNYRAQGWPDPANARAAFAEFAQCVTVALPTFDDEQALHGDASPQATIARWQRWGAEEVAVKLGARGCLVKAAGRTLLVPPRAQIAPLDSTGAGDAFNAGYLAARRAGSDPVAAASLGNELAGRVLRHHGAIIPAAAMANLAPLHRR